MNIKRILIILLALFAINLISAQTEAIPYQSILTDKEGIVLKNIETEIRMDIIQSSLSGPIVYSEMHSIVTGINGEISLMVGKGIPLSSPFINVDWAKPNYMELSFRPSGFMDFISNGKIELLSVPYALFTLKVTCREGCPGGPGRDGPDGAQGPSGPVGPDSADGSDGAQGPAGQQGVPGIETLEITNTTPSNPDVGELYIDDGSNRSDGIPGFRFFDGTQWINL